MRVDLSPIENESARNIVLLAMEVSCNVLGIDPLVGFLITEEDAEAEAGVLQQGKSVAYIIEIKKSVLEGDEANLVRKIAHEMTHIMQYENDYLCFGAHEEAIVYKGELYNWEHDGEYWLAPWEIEARGMELGIWWYYVENT